MSFNPTPEWTNDITLPIEDDIRCPACCVVAFNAETVLRPLRSVTYYQARHVPPKLVATCSNIECERCDEDFEILLSVEVKTFQLELDK